MESMDKGLTAPKWVLIVRPKIPQKPQNFSAQFGCPCPKVRVDQYCVLNLNNVAKYLCWAFEVTQAMGKVKETIGRSRGQTPLL